MTQQRVIGVVAPGTSPDAPVAREVKGSTTIVELLSIYKRLKAFEAVIQDEPLPEIDQRYLERKEDGNALAANSP